VINQSSFWAEPGKRTMSLLVQSSRRLRVQIIALFLILGLATTLIFSLGTRYAFGYSWRDLTRPLVADYVDRLAADIGSPPSIDRAKNLVNRLPLSIRLSGPTVNWQSSEGTASRPNWSRRGVGLAEDQSTASVDPARPQMLVRRSQDGHMIEFALNFSSMEHRPHGLFWLSLGSILLLMGLAYWFVRRLLSPLDEIRAGAIRFGQGDFAQNIIVRSPNELGALANEVNAMAKEIQQMLDAKRALLLAMSHELRSPLTRAKVNAELLPDEASLAIQKQALVADLNEMRDLIQDLLESEQLGGGHRALFLEETDFGLFLRSYLASSPHASRIRLKIDVQKCNLRLDQARMRLLLRNLIDNARRHGDGGCGEEPALEIRLEPGLNQSIRLSVRDFGPGVSESDLAKLAQPFYRIDSSRSRSSGGVGLGLYLSRLVAEAHRATWSIKNAHPGLEVSMEFQTLAASPLPPVPVNGTR
jgi:signal transduction histidine kinase